MSLLTLLKTKPLTCAAVGACSIAAPATVGAYAAGAFSGANEYYSPPSFDTLLNDSKSSVIEKPYSSCFNSFFPGVKIGDGNNAGHDGTIADNTVDDGKLIGCALMKLDYTDSSRFAFSAEITAKNGTHGWAIKIYLQTENSISNGSNDTYKFTYNIVFLTRNNASKKWSVDEGIYLELSNSTEITANISFPSKTLMTSSNKDSTITESSKSWFATWEESSGGKEIFDDIKVELNSTDKLYLGKSTCSNDSCEDCYPSTTMDPKRKYENRKWNANSGSIADVCTKYKDQLKDKKGTWTWYDNPETFCNELKTNAETNEVKRKKLNNYCYSYV